MSCDMMTSGTNLKTWPVTTEVKFYVTGLETDVSIIAIYTKLVS